MQRRFLILCRDARATQPPDRDAAGFLYAGSASTTSRAAIEQRSCLTRVLVVCLRDKRRGNANVLSARPAPPWINSARTSQRE